MLALATYPLDNNGESCNVKLDLQTNLFVMKKVIILLAIFAALPVFGLTKTECRELSLELEAVEKEQQDYEAETERLADAVKSEGGLTTTQVNRRIANFYDSRRLQSRELERQVVATQSRFYRGCNATMIEPDEPEFNDMPGYNCTVSSGTQRCVPIKEDTTEADNSAKIAALQAQVNQLMAILQQLLTLKGQGN